ncbi:MAG: HEAT repeat domain-containing protein [Myxococcota bacterium]|nr:HEAT repeat domain-containing protein [Myxococcota bacterium]
MRLAAAAGLGVLLAIGLYLGLRSEDAPPPAPRPAASPAEREVPAALPHAEPIPPVEPDPAAPPAVAEPPVVGARSAEWPPAGDPGPPLPFSTEAHADARELEAFPQLRDPDPELRLEGAEQLEVDGPGVKPALAFLLRNDPDRRVRLFAADELAWTEEVDAVVHDALVAALADPDPEVALSAIIALEDIGDIAAVPYLEALRTHPNSMIREAAEDAIEFLELD